MMLIEIEEKVPKTSLITKRKQNYMRYHSTFLKETPVFMYLCSVILEKVGKERWASGREIEGLGRTFKK